MKRLTLRFPHLSLIFGWPKEDLRNPVDLVSLHAQNPFISYRIPGQRETYQDAACFIIGLGDDVAPNEPMQERHRLVFLQFLPRSSFSEQGQHFETSNNSRPTLRKKFGVCSLQELLRDSRDAACEPVNAELRKMMDGAPKGSLRGALVDIIGWSSNERPVFAIRM